MAVPEIGLNPASEIHRIGPNAVTRVMDVLREELGESELPRLLALAGIAAYLRNPPEQMVDEREVTRLHEVLRDEIGLPGALRLAREAGVRTGDYLLAHRIPAPAQRVLSWLPPRLASRALLGAIQRHAWTFAGSGDLRVRLPYPPQLSIAGCCICRGATSGQPLCDYYAAAIERLFRILVHPSAQVAETACQATGADACTFRITW